MEELLRWDGVWSLDLIQLYVNEAKLIELEKDVKSYLAPAAAVSGLFSKDGPKGLLDKLLSARDLVRTPAVAGPAAPHAGADGPDVAGLALENFLKANGG